MTDRKLRSLRAGAFIGLPERFIGSRTEINGDEELPKGVHISLFMTEIVQRGKNHEIERDAGRVGVRPAFHRMELGVRGFGMHTKPRD